MTAHTVCLSSSFLVVHCTIFSFLTLTLAYAPPLQCVIVLLISSSSLILALDARTYHSIMKSPETGQNQMQITWNRVGREVGRVSLFFWIQSCHQIRGIHQDMLRSVLLGSSTSFAMSFILNLRNVPVQTTMSAPNANEDGLTQLTIRRC